MKAGGQTSPDLCPSPGPLRWRVIHFGGNEHHNSAPVLCLDGRRQQLAFVQHHPSVLICPSTATRAGPNAPRNKHNKTRSTVNESPSFSSGDSTLSDVPFKQAKGRPNRGGRRGAPVTTVAGTLPTLLSQIRNYLAGSVRLVSNASLSVSEHPRV